MKQNYRLTEDEHKALLEASKPVPVMMIGGVFPRSQYEKVNDVWRKVAARVGCDMYSIEDGETRDGYDFKALAAVKEKK